MNSHTLLSEGIGYTDDQTTASSAVDRPMRTIRSGSIHPFTLRRIVAYCGFAFPLAWAFFINAAGGSVPDRQDPWIIGYGALTVAMVVFGLFASKYKGFLTDRRIGVICILVNAAASLVLSLSYARPELALLQIPASIVCSCGLGWLYLQWGLFYAAIDTREAVTWLFLSNIVASLIKLIAHVSPFFIGITIAMAMPIASVLACWYALGAEPPARTPQTYLTRGNLKGFVKVGAAIAAFSFCTAFLIGRTVGNQAAISLRGFIFARLVEIVVCLIVLFIVVKLKKGFNFSQLWRIVLVVLAIDILCAVLLPQATLIRSVESSVWDLVVLFAWTTIADIARHTKYPVPLVFGVGWTAYTFSFTVGMALALALAPIGTLSTEAIVALMFLLVLTGAFCLEQRDQDTKWIFAELRGEPLSEPSDQRTIDERCTTIAKEYKLTPRELDVMKLLCRGRTKAYIAETLYLTENTVKGHTKHIYMKLGVHSKQELMDMVEHAK